MVSEVGGVGAELAKNNINELSKQSEIIDVVDITV